MNTSPRLRSIAALLEETDFDFRLEQKPGLPPVILLDLDCDNLVCEIVLASDLVPGSGAPGDDLLLLTRCALRVKPAATHDFVCLCALVSSLFGFGALLWCESTGVVFHRTLLAIPVGGADADVMERVLSQIQLTFQATWPLLCETAAGTRTFPEARSLLADIGFPEPALEAFPDPPDHLPFA